MSSLFGVSMNLIMYVLLALLAISVLSVLFVALRNPIMFKIGLRNIPRRRAQTTLIVLGLMLSTLIIAAAFTTGDTVNQSITSEVYSVLGSLDEIIQPSTGNDDASSFDETGSLVQPSFSQQAVAPLISDLQSDPQIDAVVPAFSQFAVAVNLDERLSSPLFNVLGLDPASMANLPDIDSTNGGRVRLEDLGPNEIYVDKTAADDLNVSAGDSIILFAKGAQTPFKVKDVVEDKRLAGAGGVSINRGGGVLSLAAAQSLFGAPGQLTQVYVSNKGNARSGVKLTDAVKEHIDAAIKALPSSAPPLTAAVTKQTGVDIAEEGANIFTTLFLVFGLFSIGAGVLLIFMIFVMLAAERKSEMGMARAVGTKRADLVQIFLSEGMAYNMLAAVVGCFLGVLVAFGISKAMGQIFSDVGISITPHVSLRSLAVSYSLGVVLTFFTVTFSSWRISQINIVRAIRDIPEPPTPRPMWQAHGILRTARDLIFKPTDRAGSIRRGLLMLAIVLFGVANGAKVPALSLVSLLLVLAAFISYSRSQTSLSTLMKVLTVIGLTLITPLSLIAGFFMTFQLGPLFFGGGLITLIVFLATNSHSAFVLLLGLSLAPLGLAMIVRSFGANERISYTLVGLYLIYIWEIDFSVHLIEKIFGKTTGDFEMFFLSGAMVTVAATFLVVYNADLILGPLTKLGSRLGAILPSLKMAVAYPLASRMRTGLTMAMFCMVIFAITMMSSFLTNFNRLYLNDSSLGGFQVTVDENPANPITDLKATLAQNGAPVANQIEAVGISSLISHRRALVCQVLVSEPCQPSSATYTTDDDPTTKAVFKGYEVRGEDSAFINTTDITFQSRARGYDSDAAIWQAIAKDATLAVIDNVAVSGGGFDASAFALDGVDPAAKQFDAPSLVVLDAANHKSANVKVIGIIEQAPSLSYSGLHVQQSVVTSVFAQPDLRRFFVETTQGANSEEVARQIESSLLTTGAQAESLRHQIDKFMATQRGFFYLIEGFMGLGLFVGVAAVGVIAFRTVVERRQQIGMLRALGYSQAMVGLTFLIESAFIAFAGVVSGAFFALILARQLITEQFANQGVHSFVIPWLPLIVVTGAAFGSALLMTLIPSRQAARIPIAEALRYE